ncbi:Fe-S-containing protein [Telmatospirillum siberiense]|nr:Fe-S-containing protein [Telmatospirillum siberiense]
MAFYIAALAHALVPAVLIIVLWTATLPAPDKPRRSGLARGVCAGALVGALAILLAIARTAETAGNTGLQVAGFVTNAATLMLLALNVRSLRLVEETGTPILARFTPILAAVEIAQGLFAAWNATVNHGLSATDVVNTDLIVNCTAILFGAALLAILALQLAKVARMAGRGPAATALAVVLVLALAVGSGQTMLGLLRLDQIGVTAERITYVARLSVIEPWQVYIDLGLTLLLILVAFRRRFRIGVTEDRIERRLRIARALTQSRWRRGLAGATALLLAILAFQDLYASRPPTLSEAIGMQADGKDEIRIPIERVKDGNLHRFAYISSAGHRVRFFLINRYDEAHIDIGVVFDACMVCGDGGYIQHGDEVICVPCNVRMFRPSIGKSGGCNPIPLPHTVEDGTIVIAASSLEKGARHFTEVVDVEVTDPVTGQKLTSGKAPFQHEAGGRTYFFGDKDSYDKFRADPDAYLRGGKQREHG